MGEAIEVEDQTDSEIAETEEEKESK